MHTDIERVETQNCGCKVTHYKTPDTAPHYAPCLACALVNAGMMLKEAGERIREERRVPDPRPARDFIDGNRK
jgi:hypothetical protein